MDLPPLNALRGFEAAARTGSFSQAGDELCVTHAAISHQIKQLEEWFGRPLFLRTGRGVELTPLGKTLSSQVSTSLGELAQSCSRLRAETDRLSIAVGSIPSIASRWLVPNLHRFTAEYPEIDIQVSYAHAEAHQQLDRYDVVIAADANSSPYATNHKLFSRESKPVCSPSYLDRHGPLATAEAIAQAALLHDESTDAWESWFRAAGLKKPPPARGPVFQDFNLLVTAAIAGHGIALCPVDVFQAELERGDLIILSDTSIQADEGYFAVTGLSRNAATAHFVKWLVSLVKENR